MPRRKLGPTTTGRRPGQQRKKKKYEGPGFERKYPDKFARKDFVEVSKGKEFDVELYWSDGNVFDEMSEMSDIKKEEE